MENTERRGVNRCAAKLCTNNSKNSFLNFLRTRIGKIMSDIPQFGFKAKDLIKSGRTTNSNVDDIKKWIGNRSDIPQMSEEQIVLFLIACNNVIEATQHTIQCYFKYKSAAPEMFANRDVDSEEMQFTLRVVNATILPKRTKENYAVLMGCLRDTYYQNFDIEQQAKAVFTAIELALYSNPPNGKLAISPKRTKDNCAILMGAMRDTRYQHYNFEHHIKTTFTAVDVALCSDPPKGFIYVIDIKGIGLLHLTRIRLGAVKKLMAYLQEGLPTQLKQVHILNASYIFDKLLMMFKPFMKKELYESIIPHPVNMPMKEFFEKYIPASCMSADFGGELPTMDQMSEDFQNECRKRRSFIKSEEKQVQQYTDNCKC